MFAILYGVPVWGFAVLWIALATSLTVRTLRRGMPFALTWWSLTFPVGTFVTGTSQLAAHTHLPAFKWPRRSPTPVCCSPGYWWPSAPPVAACAATCSRWRRAARRSRPARIQRPSTKAEDRQRDSCGATFAAVWRLTPGRDAPQLPCDGADLRGDRWLLLPIRGVAHRRRELRTISERRGHRGKLGSHPRCIVAQ